VIRLHERLSEFSYGYGVTREVEELLAGVGIKATPFLPSLLHEASLGFDVAFSGSGAVVMLQFKLGDELRRFHRSSPTQQIPVLQKPFWRFQIDTAEHQYRRLVEFEDRGAEVYYVAPRFSHWLDYERAFHKREVLERSLLLQPSAIRNGLRGAGGIHRVVYDRVRRYICSEPTLLEEVTREAFVSEVAHRARSSDLPLGAQLEKLEDRSRSEASVSTLSQARRRDIEQRAKRPVDALAAVIALEAWTQGAQVLFVTPAE
jgi:BMFP domain-containing protein YqiC